MELVGETEGKRVMVEATGKTLNATVGEILTTELIAEVKGKVVVRGMLDILEVTLSRLEEERVE